MGVMKRDLANRTEPSVYYSDPERHPDPRDIRQGAGPEQQPPAPSSGLTGSSSHVSRSTELGSQAMTIHCRSMA